MTALDHRERVGERDGDQIDEGSDRWFTAVHEAGHATAVEALGGRVLDVRITPGWLSDEGGFTRHTLTDGPRQAIGAVAGQAATRLLLGLGGGAGVDYEIAVHALSGTGHTVEWAEAHADDLLSLHRADLHALARYLYRHPW